jgi:hypothetical protein
MWFAMNTLRDTMLGNTMMDHIQFQCYREISLIDV